MTPFRVYCTTLATCYANDASTGMPVYVSKGLEFIAWRNIANVLRKSSAKPKDVDE